MSFPTRAQRAIGNPEKPIIREFALDSCVLNLRDGEWGRATVTRNFTSHGYKLLFGAGPVICYPRSIGSPQIMPTANSYRETLPANCPPEEAKCPEKMLVLRLVSTENPTNDDFKSHAALKVPIRGKESPCRWASCSVFLLSRIDKLPRLKNKTHVAHIEIDGNSGRCILGGNGHVDLWMYYDFNPLHAVIKVERRVANG